MSELVSEALQSSRQIESSDRAYFAAEAGVENALYELSGHQSGYGTPPLDELEVRQDDFNGGVRWANQWSVDSYTKDGCLENDWQNGFSPTLCGKLKAGQKLQLSLFNDVANPNNVDVNQVGVSDAAIERLNLNQLEIKFRLPKNVVSNSGLNELQIDNDEDYNKMTGEGANEDGDAGTYGTNPCDYSGNVEVDDNDCDQREDEDSPEDPVIIWRVADETGRSFQPLRGCKGDDPHPDHNAENAGLCEKNFANEGDGELSVGLNLSDRGWTADGTIQTFQEFIDDTALNSTLQMELLLVAPMVAINTQDPPEERQIAIPYYEYGIAYDAGFSEIPDPFFTIRSEGYFRDFKQSITTRVLPGQTTRLLDLTIIQQ